MRILFLDDDERRHRVVRRYTTRADHVYDAKMACEKLSGAKYDLVFLDHDLGTKEDGRDVARHIAALPEDKKPNQVIIHSMNLCGAVQMASILHYAGIDAHQVMFGYMEFMDILKQVQEKLHGDRS